jgi:transcriptional regulator of heat shock response
LKGEILELLINNYHDFGPTFATEKLVEQHGYVISAETIRKWMMEHNLWLTRK